MGWVEKYYKPYSGRLRNLGDTYMAVLWPAGIGRLDTYVMWERDSGPYQREYAANSGLDREKKGYITRGDAVSRVNEMFVEGNKVAR